MGDERKWKVGDVVRLKSGGPPMTVTEITGMAEDYVVCMWFVKEAATPQLHTFREEALEAQPKSDFGDDGDGLRPLSVRR